MLTNLHSDLMKNTTLIFQKQQNGFPKHLREFFAKYYFSLLPRELSPKQTTKKNKFNFLHFLFKYIN
jgi:hypothetical protein